MHIFLVDTYGTRDIFRDLKGDTEFRDSDIRVGGDNRASAKVYAFAHEVLTKASTFSVESVFNGLHGSTRTLDDGREGASGDFVVDEGGNVVLKHGDMLFDVAFVCILIDERVNFFVGFEDVIEDVGHVIFGASDAILFDGGPYVRRGYSEDFTDHPFGACPERIESHEEDIIIRDAFEYFEDDVSGELHGELALAVFVVICIILVGVGWVRIIIFVICVIIFWFIGVIVIIIAGGLIFPFGDDGCEVNLFDFGRLSAAATIIGVFAAAFDFACDGVDFTPSIFGGVIEEVHIFIFVDEEFAALNANAS